MIPAAPAAKHLAHGADRGAERESGHRVIERVTPHLEEVDVVRQARRVRVAPRARAKLDERNAGADDRAAEQVEMKIERRNRGAIGRLAVTEQVRDFADEVVPKDEHAVRTAPPQHHRRRAVARASQRLAGRQLAPSSVERDGARFESECGFVAARRRSRTRGRDRARAPRRRRPLASRGARRSGGRVPPTTTAS